MSARILLLFAVLVQASDAQPVLVGVAPFPPNVIETADGLTGFDVELWRETASLADLDYELRQYTFHELLQAVRTGEVDAALAGVTVTSEREAEFDFSHPYMESGLRILTRAERSSLWRAVSEAALSSEAAGALFSLALFLVLAAHLLYVAERGGGAISRRYLPGVLEAAWCALATMTTVGYGDIAPRRWLGRLVSFAVMVTGIGLFGLLVAQISAGVTLATLQGEIREPEDLAGRRVAVVAGSTSVALANSWGLRRSRSSAAAAPRRWFSTGRPFFTTSTRSPPPSLSSSGLPSTSNPTLSLFPADSPLVEEVNRALLQVAESGRRAALYERAFGAEP